jgi:hypothetical protein
MVDATVITPRELHRPMALLGKYKWLQFVQEAEGKVARIDRQMLNRALDEQPDTLPAVSVLQRLYKLNDSLGIAQYEGLCRLFADGPKLFEPTEEQFESMMHVDMNMPTADFRAPYPALVVRIPSEIRRRLAEANKIDVQRCPMYLCVRTRVDEGDDVPVVVVVSMRFGEYDVTYLFARNDPSQMMEEVFVKAIASPLDEIYGNREEELEFTSMVTRAALNFCLLMTHFGCRVAGPVNADKYKRNQKPGREKFKHSDFLAIEMLQNVRMRQHESATPPSDGPSPHGWEVKPHWRRGHWRKLAGWPTEGRLVFIRPCLVRKDRIVGDVSDSETNYRS